MKIKKPIVASDTTNKTSANNSDILKILIINPITKNADDIRTLFLLSICKVSSKYYIIIAVTTFNNLSDTLSHLRYSSL